MKINYILKIIPKKFLNKFEIRIIIINKNIKYMNILFKINKFF